MLEFSRRQETAWTSVVDAAPSPDMSFTYPISIAPNEAGKNPLCRHFAGRMLRHRTFETSDSTLMTFQTTDVFSND
jgi:hypothetical protein